MCTRRKKKYLSIFWKICWNSYFWSQSRLFTGRNQKAWNRLCYICLLQSYCTFPWSIWQRHQRQHQSIRDRIWNKWILGLTHFGHFKAPAFPGSRLQSPYLRIQSSCRQQWSEAIWSSIANACDGLWISLYCSCLSLKLQTPMTDD